MSRRLDDYRIEDYLNSLNDSEDNLESSDEEELHEENYYRNEIDLSQDLDDVTEPPLLEGLDDPPILQDNDADPPLQVQDDVPPIAPAPTASSFRRILWRQTNLVADQSKTNFPDDVLLPDSLLQLETPYQFFTYFFTTEFRQKIVTESNLYATQKNVSHPFHISNIDLDRFLGILVFSSVIKYPNFRLYWSDKYGYQPIKSTMTQKHFEKISSVLHFNDNEKQLPQNHPDHDRLYRVRPLVDELNQRYSTIPLEQRLSLDEQMCATKIGHYMKQYLPNKPHKWGFKLFVICSIYGFAHKFEIYSGNQNHPRMDDEPDLGATGNTVIRLARIIPRYANHIIYFDNYYTSVPLAVYLAKRGIYCLGTVQSNRLPNSKLPDKKTIMKRTVPRGFFVENVANVDGIEMSALVWKDNKPVTFLSTYAGALPVDTISRYDKVRKERLPIDCPKVIKDYNSHMGGVDLQDSFIGRYHITRKSRKWTNRLFYHLLDMTIINSWLVYKKKYKNTKDLLNLCNFRLELASTLCGLGERSNNGKRGRPSSSNLEAELQQKKKRGPAQTMPPKDIRLDKIDHWQGLGDRARCKYPNCKGYTYNFCVKCRVSLCYNKDNNCFYKFHTE